jgi:hypothetical protein
MFGFSMQVEENEGLVYAGQDDDEAKCTRPPYRVSARHALEQSAAGFSHENETTSWIAYEI